MGGYGPSDGVRWRNCVGCLHDCGSEYPICRTLFVPKLKTFGGLGHPFDRVHDLRIIQTWLTLIEGYL
jgi:hypothetical protein